MTDFSFTSRRTQSGFTLVELMISMVLGLILIGGVYSVFTENARTSQFVQATSRTQENGRFALSELVTRARMIGYMGCLAALDLTSGDFVNALKTGTDDDYYFDLKAGQLEVIAFDSAAASGAGNLTAPLKDDISPKTLTDVVIIRGLSSADYNLAGAMPKTSADLKLIGESEITKGDVLFLSDCQKAAVFQVTNTNIMGGTDKRNVVHNTSGGAPGNATKSLSNGDSFATDATVQLFTTTVFYIAQASFGTNSLGEDTFSLWQKNGTAPPFELVSGISDLEVWLGEDSSGDGVPDRIVRPSELSASNTKNVVSMDIRIRSDSIDPVGTDLIERDFFASVKFRNRGI